MTLMQLRCFVALAEELNFTRVAEKLFVSQTTISYQIKSLEHELGAELFERSTKAVSITPAGRHIYKDIKLAIDLVDRSEDFLRQYSVRDSFTIGYSLLVSGEYLHRAVKELSDAFPDTDIYVEHVEPEDDVHGKLITHALDAAVFMNPYGQLHEELEYVDFGQMRRCIFVSYDHPYAKLENGILERDLRSEKVVTFAQVERRRQTETDVVDNSRLIIARDINSAFEMVASNLAIACFPGIGTTDLRGIKVVPVVDTFPEMEVKLNLVWQKDNESPLIPRFRKIYKRRAEELIALLGSRIETSR